jgi:1-acyl-sn-glycerol-3-phosphate acyltransferase
MKHDPSPGRHTWKYAIFKFIVKTVIYVFYRRIHVAGLENVPTGGKIIFAANHQNALMDALAVIVTSNYQPVFLARADIFTRPFIARILGIFKIIPVYRLRDGMETMVQNQDTFEKTSQVLASGGCIGIMPEGNHGDKKRLRILKKGIFRIAFKAGGLAGSDPDVKIVPVGLDYSRHDGFFEELVVNYGPPVLVSDYLKLYSGHPQKGINAMKRDLSESLRSLIIDIKDEENYESDKMLIEIGSLAGEKKVARRFACHFGRFVYAKAFCQSMYEYFEKNPEHAGKIRSQCRNLLKILSSRGLSPLSVRKLDDAGLQLARLKRILCFPVYLAGAILHILPLSVIHLKLKLIRDPQFISSFKFVLGLVLVPVNYIFLSVIFFSLFSPLLAALLLGILPLSGFLAYSCFRYSEKLKEIIYFNSVCKQENQVAENINDLRLKIVGYLGPVFHNTEEKLK